MGDDDLVRRNSELSKTSGTFLRESQQQIGIELHLTAANAKYSLPGELVSEFTKVLDGESAEALQWAFRAWRDRSAYFPAISEIRGLLEEWHRGKREQAEVNQSLEEKLRFEEARAAGKLVSFPEVIAKLKDVARMPEAPPNQCRTVGMRVTPPAVPLTKQQIAERRPGELAEIERALRESDGTAR